MKDIRMNSEVSKQPGQSQHHYYNNNLLLPDFCEPTALATYIHQLVNQCGLFNLLYLFLFLLFLYNLFIIIRV